MRTTVLAALVVLAAASADAQAVVGQNAPDFALTDTSGRPVSLAGLRGKAVVLEWWNPECPFVGKHYNSGNMQRLQKEWTGKGVVWLAVNSSAPGKQGHLDAARAAALVKEKGGAATGVLLDADGKLGRAYGAKTTPHMFVIDPGGLLVYAGGIDDKASADPTDIKTARNHVSAALAEVTAGKTVSVPSTTPYGCGVKYGP